MIVRFIVPGQPHGKARPRFANGHAYTDEKTREYEQLVAIMYKTVAGKTMFPPDTPLSVHIHTYAYIAKSASKAKKDSMLKGLIRPMAKPDTDNIAKCILDALNKVAYPDDKQIVELSVSKYYSDNPCVVVEITEAEKGEP